jgi:hypothetical protein
MAEQEPSITRGDGRDDAARQLDRAVPSLEAALHATPEERVDGHLGRGVRFRLGPEQHTSLELYPQVVRVSLPHAQLAVPRRAPEVAPEGVVFQDPEQFFLSVGPTGEILFQSSPAAAASGTGLDQRQEATRSTPPPLPAPRTTERSASPPQLAATAKEKAKSERYVGRLGEVRTHRTKQGKLVAEVEMTVADPDRPGASMLVKFAAFGEKAEALARDYQPGQEVTAVGIPHELKRRGKEGREWTERQLYFVQLPKPR